MRKFEYRPTCDKCGTMNTRMMYSAATNKSNPEYLQVTCKTCWYSWEMGVMLPNDEEAGDEE